MKFGIFNEIYNNLNYGVNGYPPLIYVKLYVVPPPKYICTIDIYNY